MEMSQNAPSEVGKSLAGRALSSVESGATVAVMEAPSELPTCPPPPRTSDTTVILTLGGILVAVRLISRAIRRRSGI